MCLPVGVSVGLLFYSANLAEHQALPSLSCVADCGQASLAHPQMMVVGDLDEVSELV
jgi:hypothetical protein